MNNLRMLLYIGWSLSFNKLWCTSAHCDDFTEYSAVSANVIYRDPEGEEEWPCCDPEVEDNWPCCDSEREEDWPCCDYHHHHPCTTELPPDTRITESEEPWGSSITTNSPQCGSITFSSDGQNITWPATPFGGTAVSDPLCIADKQVVSRRCNDLGEWESLLTCTPQPSINPCPADLKSSTNGRFCYTTIDNVSFENIKCPYPQQAAWDDYMDLTDIFPKAPVWIPVKRNDKTAYGIDIYRYVEITRKYKDPYQICTDRCNTFFYDGTFLDKTCLVHHNSSHIQAVRCNETHTALCVYDALQYQKSSFCGTFYNHLCKQGEYDPTSLCYCETEQADDLSEEILADFPQPYQNLLFPNSSCRIGLVKNALNFTWVDGTPIDYTYWAPSVNYSYHLGVLTGDGWILGNETFFNCSIYKLDPDVSEISGDIDFYYESDSDELLLNIFNYTNFLSEDNKKPAVYCFTDAEGKSLTYRITEFNKNSVVNDTNYQITFPPISSSLNQAGPGNYWCETFIYPDFISSSRNTFIDHKHGEYVVLFRLKNYESQLSAFPLTPENLETLQNLFRNELPSNTTSFYPRIFKINGIDEGKKEINITFHLTSSKAENTDEEFIKLLNLCQMQQIFEYVDFRSVDYCAMRTELNSKEQSITWPRTVYGSSSYPLGGYCLTDSLTLVRRYCTNDFINGAHWSELKDNNCEFYASSSQTDDIVYLTKSNDTFANITALSANASEFNTLDFVLVTKFVHEAARSKPDMDLVTNGYKGNIWIDLIHPVSIINCVEKLYTQYLNRSHDSYMFILELVNNLMLVPSPVLRRAQTRFRSTDLLLEAVDIILEGAEFGEWISAPNFAAICKDIKAEGVLGFQVQNCVNFTDCDIRSISTSLNETDLNNLFATVNISEKLHQQIIDYSAVNHSYTPKLAMALYYGTQLFVGSKKYKSSNIVFGIQLPGFTDQEFKGPVTIKYYKNAENHTAVNCSYWSFGDTSNWTIENNVESGDTVKCEFYHLTNFGLPVYDNSFYSTEEMCFPDDVVSRTCFSIDQYLQESGMCTQKTSLPPLNSYCVTDDLTMVPISCFANFSTQAAISGISENCSVYPLATLMDDGMRFRQILDLYNESQYDSALNMLLNLTFSYENITTFEMLMVVSVLRAISNESLDMFKVAVLVSNAMKTPATVLYNAQSNYKLIDLMLASVETIIGNGECGEWRTEKFAIKCLEINESTLGLILENCSKSNEEACDLQPFNHSCDDLKSNLASESVNGLVLLSEALHYQILSYKQINKTYIPKLIVCIYYSAELFVDLQFSHSPSLVFGVRLPGFFEEFNGPLCIFYIGQYNYCSYWNFSYSSWTIESSVVTDHVAECHFYHLSYLSMSLGVMSSLYSDHLLLPDDFHVIESPYTNVNKIYKKNHSTFDEILQKAASFKTLHSMMNIVDELMKAVEEGLITDTEVLLNDIDRALQNYNKTDLAEGQNVLLITINSEDSKYFQGLIITEDQQVSCVYNNAVSSNENGTEVAIIFSPELLQKIRITKSRIIFAIYYNTKLFPSARVILRGPIIEVLLPEISKARFRGEIFIKYSKALGRGECSYWNHPGYWKMESTSTLDPVTCTFQHVTHFGLVSNFENITLDLQEILASNLTPLEKLEQVYNITVDNHPILKPIDVSLISQIINSSMDVNVQPNIISQIVSQLFKVPRHILSMSQGNFSATDGILSSVDRMVENASDLEIHESNFSVIVKSLASNNLVGVVLHDCKNVLCSFEFLKAFGDVDDFVKNTSTDAIVVLDRNLIRQIRKAGRSPKLAISVYYSSVFFNEHGVQRNTTKVFGVTFPGIDKTKTKKLKGNVTIMNKVKSDIDGNRCAYWNFSDLQSQWMNESNTYDHQSMAICNYSHVTHFGMLLANNNDLDNDPVLHYITDIGCVFSIFGVLVILFTALVFKKWRQNTGNKILVNFSLAISLKIITLYISAYVRSIDFEHWCTITGLVLHYAILSECAWMFTVAILQFKRFVQVLGGPPKYIFLKALICGWVFPILPVVCVVSIDRDNYKQSLANLCYPSDLGLYLGVWLPVLFIWSINFVIFIFIIYNVFHKKTECIDNNNQEILFQWRLTLLLFFMLGINLAFGFLGQLKGGKLFTYLYSISASLQGFVLFLFFIVFNKSTRLLYAQSIKHWFYARGIFRVWQRSKERNKM